MVCVPFPIKSENIIFEMRNKLCGGWWQRISLKRGKKRKKRCRATRKSKFNLSHRQKDLGDHMHTDIVLDCLVDGWYSKYIVRSPNYVKLFSFAPYN